MLGFVSAHITWNALSNLELRRLYKASSDDQLLLSTTTLSNIRPREYELTMETIMKQLPLQNNDRLGWDGWTSTDKLAITSVIVYYMEGHWALREVEIAFDQVDCLFVFLFRKLNKDYRSRANILEQG